MKIIIAEDDPAICDLMREVCKRQGYDAEIFNNAENIYNGKFEEPDLFLIDKQLQCSDGLEVCRVLKNRVDKNTPVIIFSASRIAGLQATAAGADDFIEKPFKIKDMIKIIEKHLNKSLYE